MSQEYTIIIEIFFILEDDIHIAIIVLICVDAFLEALAAALLIAANVYCSGLSALPELTNFNYCN